MNKESLEIIFYEITNIIDKSNISPEDKIELLINLRKFLIEDYENSIKVLQKYRNGKKYEI
jgi:hypothetical protein